MSESDGNLEARSSAEIIAFPQPARAQPPRAHPPCAHPPCAQASTDGPPRIETPAEHLRRALAMLEAAQAQQRATLVEWRDAMAQLGTSANGLHNSLSAYQARLEQIHHR
jgi:hypothetical protein